MVHLKMVYCTDIYTSNDDKRDINKYLILNEFLNGIDQFFASTYLFWKPKHTKYLLQIGFKQLVIETIPNNFLIQSKLNLHKGMNHFLDTRNLLQLITGFNYASKTKLFRTKRQMELFIRKICRITIPFEFIGVDLKLDRMNIDVIISTFFGNHIGIGSSITGILKWHGIYVRLMYYDKKKNSKEWQKVISNDVQQYKLMKVCFNPLCKLRKYRRNINSRRELLKYLDTGGASFTLIKIKFFKCKGCFTAIYCSKKCQKIHWNVYDHKIQC
eukprot:167896_1